MQHTASHLISDSVGTGLGAGRVFTELVGALGVVTAGTAQALARRFLPMPAEGRSFIRRLPAQLGEAGYAHSTAARYTRCVSVFLTWCYRRGVGGDRVQDTSDFLAWLRVAGYGHSVQRLHLSALRTVFDRLHGQNFTSGIGYVPASARTVPASDAQVRQLLSKASARDALLITLSSSVGLRPGELAGLRWRDIAGDGSVVTVPRGRRKHPVPLPVPDELASRLAQLRAQTPEPADHVFGGRAPGRGLSVRGIQAAVARLANRCGTETSCTSLVAAAQARPPPTKYASATLPRGMAAFRADRPARSVPSVRGPPPKSPVT